MSSIKPLKSASRLEVVLPSFLLLLAVVVSLAGILGQSGQVMGHPMDQAFVTRADLRLYHDQQG